MRCQWLCWILRICFVQHCKRAWPGAVSVRGQVLRVAVLCWYERRAVAMVSQHASTCQCILDACPSVDSSTGVMLPALLIYKGLSSTRAALLRYNGLRSTEAA